MKIHNQVPEEKLSYWAAPISQLYPTLTTLPWFCFSFRGMQGLTPPHTKNKSQQCFITAGHILPELASSSTRWSAIALLDLLSCSIVCHRCNKRWGAGSWCAEALFTLIHWWLYLKEWCGTGGYQQTGGSIRNKYALWKGFIKQQRLARMIAVQRKWTLVCLTPGS